MTYQNVLVTGANRGIGLEFVRQLLDQNPPPKNVIATTRSTSSQLDDLKKVSPSNLHILTLDVTKYASYSEFIVNVQKLVGDEGVDLLVNNAGIFVRDNLESVTPKDLLTNIEVNAVAPLALTKALLPLLLSSTQSNRKTVIANISSLFGSIGDNTSGGSYSYRSSKAAINMLSKSLSVDLKSSGIIVLALHPGWVQTDMGSARAAMTPQQSVAGMLGSIEKADISKTGAFFNYAGKELPW